MDKKQPMQRSVQQVSVFLLDMILYWKHSCFLGTEYLQGGGQALYLISACSLKIEKF